MNTDERKNGRFIDEYSYGVVEPEDGDDFTEQQFFISIPKVQKLFPNVDKAKKDNPLDAMAGAFDVGHKAIPQNLYRVKELNVVRLPDSEFDIGIILFEKTKGKVTVTLGAWFQFDQKLEDILENEKEVWIVDGFSIESRIPITRIDTSAFNI